MPHREPSAPPLRPGAPRAAPPVAAAGGAVAHTLPTVVLASALLAAGCAGFADDQSRGVRQIDDRFTDDGAAQERFAFDVAGARAIDRGPILDPIPGALSRPGLRIAVMVQATRGPLATFPGADCMLCEHAVTAGHAALQAHVAAMAPPAPQAQAGRIASALQARGVDVHVVPAPTAGLALPVSRNFGPRVAERDFTTLRTPLGADVLVGVAAQRVEVATPHLFYAKAGPLRIRYEAVAFAVDLHDNRYAWRRPIRVERTMADTLDRTPSPQALADIYEAVLHEAQAAMLAPLASASAPAAGIESPFAHAPPTP